MPRKRNKKNNNLLDKNEKINEDEFKNTNTFDLLMVYDDNDNNIETDVNIETDINIKKNNKLKVVCKKKEKEKKNTKLNKKIIKKDTENVDKEIKELNTKSIKNIESKNIYIPPTMNNDNWETSNKKQRHRDKRKKKNINLPELDKYDEEKELDGNSMKLNSKWIVWIHDKQDDDWSIESYKNIYTIDNIGKMWRFLSVFNNLDKMKRQYFIMREGVMPIWEDNHNKNGAICSIMFDNVNRYNNHRSDISVDAFIAICILVINETFVKNNTDINGLCYSIKNRNVLIKLWIADYENNTNFIERLPINLLKKIDNLISMNDKNGYSLKQNNKSRVSIQIKKIIPNY